MENENDWKKDFDPDELKALGEVVEEKPPEKPPEGENPPEKTAQPAPEKPAADKEGDNPPVKPEPEQKIDEAQQTPEEKAAMSAMGLRVEEGFIIDDDGTKIPAQRWKKLYHGYQERGRELELNKRKTDLLKQLGRDEYFKLYPDEAPAGYKPKAQPQPQATALPLDDPRILSLKIQGGTYDGMTLEEVFDVNKADAIKMYSGYVSKVNEQISKSREVETRTQQEQENAVRTFGMNRAKELFNVEDPNKLTPEQVQKINQVGKDVLDWQVLHGKLHLDFEDAYALMNYENRLSKAKEEGAANALKGLQKPPVLPSIDTKGGAVKDTGWESMSAWTNDQMAAHLDTLNEKAYDKFLKEAPASIKAKFKSIPWS